jgi:HK97 family phage prohead protease
MDLPRDDLVRALYRPLEVREAEDGSSARPKLRGHFAVFNEWTEINSIFEGHFMERIAPGAFNKTIRERRDQIKVTFNHGRDMLGNQVLGPIEELREDDIGGFYEVGLLEGIPDLLMNGLRAGQYGASFRFGVVREEFDEDVKASAHNPKGLPERSLTELRLHEFGPVTFPAYPEATAEVRSLTDSFMLTRALEKPDLLREVFDRAAALPPEEEPVVETTPDEEPSRSTQRPSKDYTRNEQEFKPWRL